MNATDALTVGALLLIVVAILWGRKKRLGQLKVAIGDIESRAYSKGFEEATLAATAAAVGNVVHVNAGNSGGGSTGGNDNNVVHVDHAAFQQLVRVYLEQLDADGMGALRAGEGHVDGTLGVNGVPLRDRAAALGVADVHGAGA